MKRLALVFLAVLAVFTTNVATAVAARPAVQAVALTGASATLREEDEPAAEDSPRASVNRFLQLSRKGQWAEASRYLEMSRGQEKRSEELTERLYVVLSRGLVLETAELSAAPEGRKDDGLAPNIEELGRLGNTSEPKTPVRLVRREPKDGEDGKWLFSAATVGHVDAWYNALGDMWIRRFLPPIFFVEVWRGFLVHQLITLPVVALLAFAIGALIARLLEKAFAYVVRNERWRNYVLATARPAGLLISLALAHLVLRRLGFYLTAFVVLARLRDAIIVIAIAWAVLRVGLKFAAHLRERKDIRDRAGRRTLVELGSQTARFILIVVAFLWVLNSLGFAVGSLLTGLGIGGVAFALAAQKTVEHLFGSVSILADQPFRVDEMIRVDGIEGIVERIGLRSTRIRTVDRTLVVIPNGKLADMRIEAFGPRDRMRIQIKAEIDGSCEPDRIGSTMAAIRERIVSDDNLRNEGIIVHLPNFVRSGVELEVICYSTHVMPIDEFAGIRQALILDVFRIFNDRGLKLLISLPQPPMPKAATLVS